MVEDILQNYTEEQGSDKRQKGEGSRTAVTWWDTQVTRVILGNTASAGTRVSILLFFVSLIHVHIFTCVCVCIKTYEIFHGQELWIV